jgi:hypothetical protein
MEWKLLDQEVVAAKGLTHAALLLGEQPPESFQLPPGARDIRLPTLTALDWMRRGLLAERLFHDDEALLAYKVGGRGCWGGGLAWRWLTASRHGLAMYLHWYLHRV